MRLDPPPALPIAAPPPGAIGRNLVPLDAKGALVANDPAPVRDPSAEASRLSELTGRVDIRQASPKEISSLSLDLYAAGVISFDDYSVLAFQPELHPDYDRTIGALTGEPARPDRRRDFVGVWDERLQFDLRHQPRNSEIVRQSSRILNVLKQLAEPTQIDI